MSEWIPIREMSVEVNDVPLRIAVLEDACIVVPENDVLQALGINHLTVSEVQDRLFRQHIGSSRDVIIGGAVTPCALGLTFRGIVLAISNGEHIERLDNLDDRFAASERRDEIRRRAKAIERIGHAAGARLQLNEPQPGDRDVLCLISGSPAKVSP